MIDKKDIVGWATINGRRVPITKKGDGSKVKKGEGSRTMKGSPSKMADSDHDRAVARHSDKSEVRKQYEEYMSKLKTLKGKEREEFIKKASRG